MRRVHLVRAGTGLVALAVVGTSAYGILRINASALSHERGRVAVGVVRSEATTIHQLEDQAEAEGGARPELAVAARASARAARAALAEARVHVGQGDGVGSIGVALEEYLSVTRDQLALYRAGRLEAGDALDKEHGDPAFDTLRAEIGAADKILMEEAHRAEIVSGVGTILILGLVLAAAGLLSWRLSSAKQDARKAFSDPLTGLPNRLLLTDRLAHALALAHRNGGQVAVLFVDLDDFKRVNDTLGHAAGDTLLVAVARRLSGITRASDTISRLGGDEFAIVVEGMAGQSTAIETAERIAEALAAPFEIAGHTVTMTVSVGCAISELGASADDLLRNADLAMYAGKRQGKRCIVLYEPSMYEVFSDRLMLESELREALTRDEITVAYQPIVEVESGRLRSFEALARWTHPVRGAVGPGLFIPLAEETGMIREIGRFVLREATATLRRWQAERPLVPPLELAVNVSPVQFQHGQIVDDVREALRESGIDPATLTLEVTESVLVERGDSFRSTLEELRGLGVRLAVDDFGTGYSSLAFLHGFPIQTLKIDRAFIGNVTDGNGGLQLVRSIVELGRALGLDAVAEGIETAAQVDVLREISCTFGQGFHYSRPLPREAAEALLRESAPPSPAEPRQVADDGPRPAPRPVEG